jgi:hypothetical protein
MTTIPTDTCSLSEFQRAARTHLKRLKESGRPEMLTVDGKPELVVQALESYQRLLDIVKRAEAAQGVRRGGLEEETARGIDHDRRLADVLDEIALHCARLPVRDPRSADEILGYDQNGLPH